MAEGRASRPNVVARWVENPYWQWFRGFEYVQHAPPIEPSSLTRWRQRIGAEGMETLLAETWADRRGGQGREPRAGDRRYHGAAQAHPSDARLCLRALNLLVGTADA